MINASVVRDGKPYPPASLEELKILPGADEAIRLLHEAGFVIVVVTNQPDVATGIQTIEVVEAIHSSLRNELMIDHVKVCYHIDADNCACRKPKPGMLLESANDFNIDLAKSFMVGDRWRDIEAGKAAGCHTFFIDYSYEERNLSSPDVVVASLKEASELILSPGN